MEVSAKDIVEQNHNMVLVEVADYMAEVLEKFPVLVVDQAT